MQALGRPRSIQFWLRWLVAIVILPGWVATATMIGLSYERERTTLQSRAIGTARALLQAVEHDLAGAESGLKVLALSPYLAAGDLEAFHRHAREVLREQPGNGIVLTDPYGQQLMSTIVPYGTRLPPSGVPDLVRTVVDSGKPAVSDLYRGATSRRPQVAVAVPVLRDGRVAYVLIMGLLPERLSEILRRQIVRTAWIGAIYDSQGTIVARTEAQETFIGRKGPPALLRRIAEVPEDAITVRTLEGIPVFAGFSHSARLGWSVVVGIPRATLAAEREKSLWISAGGAAALFLLGLWLAQLFSLRIARSIAALTSPALALASGHSATARLKTDVEEVNEVGEALTKAAHLLDERTHAREVAEQAGREMAQAKEAAERNSEAKSQFLAMMSHELRTPLHGILGFAQLMDAQYYGPLTAKQKEFVDAILFSGNHLLELINDVLELSRIEAGRITVSVERVELTPVMKSVIATLTPVAEKAGIALRAGDFGQHLPPVKVDRVRLAQCLLNLGTNAIKYNHPDGSVTFSYGIVDGRARISVTDTGPGIAKERQAELFEAFNRLGMERTGIEGTGVGLTLTRRLVELMGGKIGFVSSPGQGSCFWIDLPLHEVATQAPAATHAPAAPHIGAATILYVEDNPSNILLMRNLIATLPDVRLIEAMSGEAGVAAAARYRPDLIIVDINLPDTNGVAVLKRLRSLPTAATTPVLALSATASPSEVRRGLDAGFLAYLTKPIDVVEFLNVVETALAGATRASPPPALAATGDATPHGRA